MSTDCVEYWFLLQSLREHSQMCTFSVIATCRTVLHFRQALRFQALQRPSAILNGSCVIRSDLIHRHLISLDPMRSVYLSYQYRATEVFIYGFSK